MHHVEAVAYVHCKNWYTVHSVIRIERKLRLGLLAIRLFFTCPMQIRVESISRLHILTPYEGLR
jgi:hypothetical protein